jgi:hypothetical protein
MNYRDTKTIASKLENLFCSLAVERKQGLADPAS